MGDKGWHVINIFLIYVEVMNKNLRTVLRCIKIEFWEGIYRNTSLQGKHLENSVEHTQTHVYSKNIRAELLGLQLHFQLHVCFEKKKDFATLSVNPGFFTSY